MHTVLSRRRFVQGLGLGFGGVALACGLPASRVRAEQLSTQYALTGKTIDLAIGATPVNFTGRARPAVTVNRSLPAPILRWREGDRVRINVHNQLPDLTAIHWHGIVLPYQQDGVPGISFPGIHPGTTFTHEFELRQSGTYWYHGHAGFQEQVGLYGAIVIEPRDDDELRCERDYVIVLSDWSDSTPEHVLSRLKKDPAYYNYQQRTIADSWRDIQKKGLLGAWREREMWNQMRMSDRDLADVTGATYTFLMNGHTPQSNWTGLFKPGERVRLRFINAGAMTFFDVRIPNLKMRVIAADGNPVEPISVDEFRLGNAETLDVIVEPKADMAYTIFAQALDRSGFARGTLTSNPALIAEIPALDAPLILGNKEMGHGEMGIGGAHASHNAASTDHSGHAGMDHSSHAVHAESAASIPVIKTPIAKNNPGVDMRADNPQPMLNDPGIGLRNNGRVVLTYADLAHRDMAPDMREPEREIELHLTGNMERYMWSIDGISYADAEPLHFKLGERLRITLVNDTMMHHPVHLHGMWSDLETGNIHHLPRKHTVTVKPGEKISYRVTVDAPGAWAYHCHLMYHMDLGMFRKVVVS